MSLIKTYLVENGGMTFIRHNSDNFSIIDCNLCNREKEIINEIKNESSDKEISRFISTHPDEDHIGGLNKLDDAIPIFNFYCVNNKVTKPDETESFNRYKALRDGEKAYHIYKDCSRRWMNVGDDERGSSGINIIWPDTGDQHFLDALSSAENGESPNNISAIIHYKLSNGVSALWMGDLETSFMEQIEDKVSWPKVGILFAPHHGRKSGKVPKSILDKLDPKVIIIGHAEKSEYINYYQGYNTIKRTSGGDILMDCHENLVDFFCSKDNYTEDFLVNQESHNSYDNMQYIGSIEIAEVD